MYEINFNHTPGTVINYQPITSGTANYSYNKFYTTGASSGPFSVRYTLSPPLALDFNRVRTERALPVIKPLITTKPVFPSTAINNFHDFRIFSAYDSNIVDFRHAHPGMMFGPFGFKDFEMTIELNENIIGAQVFSLDEHQQVVCMLRISREEFKNALSVPRKSLVCLYLDSSSPFTFFTDALAPFAGMTYVDHFVKDTFNNSDFPLFTMPNYVHGNGSSGPLRDVLIKMNDEAI